MTLKRFTITETRPMLLIRTFEVEADNEDEALAMVENGEVDCYDADHRDENPFQYSQFDVIDVKENETFY